MSQPKQVDSLSVFNPVDYPDSSYRVFHREYKFSNYHIFLSNVSPASEGACNSFVLITKGYDTIYHKCFPNIQSLGGCSGIYSSDSNQFSDYFFISKFGDYDGHLIILNREGKILNIRGSSFYFSKDHTFVFSDQDSDIGGLTVWDLKKNKLLYDSEARFIKGDFTIGERFLKEIRYDKNFHYLIYLKDPDDENAAQLFTLKFNNQSGLITQGCIDKNYLRSLQKLTIYNSPSLDFHCSCHKPGMH